MTAGQGPTLDLDARYTVAGYRGVAFYLLGWSREQFEVPAELVCEDVDCEHETESCWIPPYIDDRESDREVRAVMVGDDRIHYVDVEDLTLLDDDDYCHECGQVGCTHDGRER